MLKKYYFLFVKSIYAYLYIVYLVKFYNFFAIEVGIEAYEQLQQEIATAFVEEMYSRAPYMYKSYRDKIE